MIILCTFSEEQPSPWSLPPVRRCILFEGLKGQKLLHNRRISPLLSQNFRETSSFKEKIVSMASEKQNVFILQPSFLRAEVRAKERKIIFFFWGGGGSLGLHGNPARLH